MSRMTEQEAWELDELLTRTTPEVSDSNGPFIKQRHTLVALDRLSADYLFTMALATKKSPTEIISELVQKEIAAAL